MVQSGAGAVGSSFQHEAEVLQEPVTVPVEQELSTDAPTSSSEASLPPTSPCGSPSTESEDSPASPVPSELTFSEPSSPDNDAFLGPEYHPITPHLQTYRLVGDNIDKNVKPRNMTSDHQTRSLHYFHTYAVRDRIDLSKFSSDLPVPDVSKFDWQKLLPSNDDKKVLYENVAILIGRCLKKNMPFFAKFGAGLEKHILHEFSDQMSAKSEVVRLLLYIHLIYQIVWPYIASTFE